MSHPHTISGKLVPGSPYSKETIQEYLKNKTAFEAWQVLQAGEKNVNDKLGDPSKKKASDEHMREKTSVNLLNDKNMQIIIHGNPSGHQIFSHRRLDEKTSYRVELYYNSKYYPVVGEKRVWKMPLEDGSTEYFVCMPSREEERTGRTGGYAGVSFILRDGYTLKRGKETEIMDEMMEAIIKTGQYFKYDTNKKYLIWNAPTPEMKKSVMDRVENNIRKSLNTYAENYITSDAGNP